MNDCTPTPWKPQKEFGSTWTVRGPNNIQVALLEQFQVSVDDPTPLNNPEVDAPIMAASHKMLEALEAWQTAEDMVVGDDRTPGRDARYAAKMEAKVRAHQMMRAAISQARAQGSVVQETHESDAEFDPMP